MEQPERFLPAGLTGFWSRAWELLALGPPGPEVLANLVERYGEPHRAYHTLRHLEECFARFDEAASLAARPGELLLALWFHDAVYDTRASNNEDRSAALAERVIQGLGGEPELAARVRELILATRHDAAPGAGDRALIADIDLAILGAEEARFEEYERQIRHEFDWVPESLFREARTRILDDFLARPAIYGTPPFAARFEERARANLRRSLARLAGR